MLLLAWLLFIAWIVLMFAIVASHGFAGQAFWGIQAALFLGVLVWGMYFARQRRRENLPHGYSAAELVLLCLFAILMVGGMGTCAGLQGYSSNQISRWHRTKIDMHNIANAWENYAQKQNQFNAAGAVVITVDNQPRTFRYTFGSDVLDLACCERVENALRDPLRDRDRGRHRADHTDLRCSSDAALHQIVVQQQRAFERGRRALVRMAEDPDQDPAGLELRQRVAHSLCARERVVLETRCLEARSSRIVVIRSERDDQDVGFVGLLVSRDAPRLRLDRRHLLLTELDPRFRDVAVVEDDFVPGLAPEQDVQLRVAEVEGLAPVDERDAKVVGGLGEARRELQPCEAGTEYQHVLLQSARPEDIAAAAAKLAA